MIGIYCRISKKKEEGKDVSIATQKEQGVLFAESIGEEYSFFVDSGISGTLDDIDERPEFAELLQAIEKGEITGVYCIDQSRLERNPKIWQLFQFIIEKNKCKFYPNAVETDVTDPMTRMATGILSLTNELYAKLTSKKVKLAIHKNAKDGKSHGLTAFGYKKDKEGFIAINDEQAEIVKRIYDLSLTGTGTYTIAKILNEENIPTKFNSFTGEISRKDKYTNKVTKFKKEDVNWRGNVIYDMIKNPIYKGFRKWGDESVNVPAIIEEEKWDQVVKNLQDNKKMVGKREEYNYLLNGILYCDCCGYEFRGKKRLKGNDNAYKCKGRAYSKCSESRGINIEKIETFIIHHLFLSKDLQKHLESFPTDPDATSVLNQKLETLTLQANKLERKIKKLRNLLLDDELENDDDLKEEYKSSKKTLLDIKSNIETVQEKIFDSVNELAKKRVENLTSKFDVNQSFKEVKKLVHSLIEKIIIKHEKEEKGGFFVFQIKYKGFEELSIFTTNWQALKWYWMNHYRKQAYTDEQLQEDREVLEGLYDFYGIDKPIDENFKGLESSSGGTSIQLKKDELIKFE